MENTQDIGNFILKLDSLIKESFVGKVKFDYRGFFELLLKHRKLSLLQNIPSYNQIDFNSGYKVDSNETLERIFKQILDELIKKDIPILKDEEDLKNIVLALSQKIKTPNFKDLIKFLLSQVNLSHFERLKLLLSEDFNLSRKISLITLIGALSFSSGCVNDATHTGTPNTHREEVVKKSTTHGVLQELTQWQKEVWRIGKKMEWRNGTLNRFLI